METFTFIVAFSTSVFALAIGCLMIDHRGAAWRDK